MLERWCTGTIQEPRGRSLVTVSKHQPLQSQRNWFCCLVKILVRARNYRRCCFWKMFEVSSAATSPCLHTCQLFWRIPSSSRATGTCAPGQQLFRAGPHSHSACAGQGEALHWGDKGRNRRRSVFERMVGTARTEQRKRRESCGLQACRGALRAVCTCVDASLMQQDRAGDSWAAHKNQSAVSAVTGKTIKVKEHFPTWHQHGIPSEGLMLSWKAPAVGVVVCSCTLGHAGFWGPHTEPHSIYHPTVPLPRLQIPLLFDGGNKMTL